jgi:tetratricopeptide (TPR) repeat protein
MTADAAEPDVARQSRAKVFISYSRKDMAFADRLEAALKSRDFEPLIDRTDIYAFEDWWQRIEALIARADTVVFVLSPDSAASEVARKEVAFAASLNKRFAPILLRPVTSTAVPEAIAKLNFVFFDDEARFEASADRLAEALDTDIAWIRQHTAFGEQARHWALANGAGGLLLRSPVLEQAERWIAARPRGAPAPTEETQVFIRASRQAATRRRNILTGSLAAGLVLALGLAGLAYWQRGLAVEQRSIAQQNEAQAKEQRDKATRNFQLAQRTAESLVFDIAHGLRNVQGMNVETVRKILDTARATFEQLAASAPDDPTLQRSRSVMLSEFGETYQTLGELDAALRAYRDSLAINERLGMADPGNTSQQSDLSVCYDKVGDVLKLQGKLADALQAYHDSLAIRVRLVAANPRNPLWQRDLSVSYHKVGDVLMEQGQLADALQAYRHSVAIAELLAAHDSNNAQWQADLAIAYNKIGDVLVVQGKLEDALKSYRNSLAITERLAAADPSNTQRQRSLSVAYERVGDVLKMQGQIEEALKTYRDSLGIMARLAATDPSNTEWQRDLSISYNKIGDIVAAQGRFAEALKAYRGSLAIRERLAAADPSNTEWQRDLSVSFDKVGNMLINQRQFAQALQAYQGSLAVLERLAAADPSNMQWQRDLSVAHSKIGVVHEAQGKLEEALQAYRDSLAIGERVAAIDRSNTNWQQILLTAIEKIGGIAYKFVLARKFAIALECADQSLSLAPDLIWLHGNRAHALMFLGRDAEAQTIYLRYRGEQRLMGDKSWETAVLEDFAELRRAKLTHPLMDEIEALFASRG